MKQLLIMISILISVYITAAGFDLIETKIVQKNQTIVLVDE